MAAGRKTGGRQRGTKNKATQEKEAAFAAIVAEAKAQGITPLEVMLETMRDHWQHGRRSEACSVARDVAPYMHPRLQAIQGGDDDAPLRMVGELVWASE